jgi:hypothetical protein
VEYRGWEWTRTRGGRSCSSPSVAAFWVHGGRDRGQLKEVLDEVAVGVWSPQVTVDWVVVVPSVLRIIFRSLLLSRSFAALFFLRRLDVVPMRWSVSGLFPLGSRRGLLVAPLIGRVPGLIFRVLGTRGDGWPFALSIGLIARFVQLGGHGGWSCTRLGSRLGHKGVTSHDFICEGGLAM